MRVRRQKNRLRGRIKLKTVIFYMILLLTAVSYCASTGNYYVLYENFNYERPTALSSSTGAYLFDFLPVDLDDLNDRMKLIVSGSVFVKQEGTFYGRNVKNGENVDLLKNFSMIWNHKKDFMPFISYHTPYKAVLNVSEREEYIKKRDALSIGIISDLEGHQIGMSFDALLSTQYVNQLDPVSERIYSRAGFSARMFMNKKMNKRSSMFLSVVSPSFWEFDYGDHAVDPDYVYFDRFYSSTGFNYKHKNYFAVYSFVYKNFKTVYDRDDGRQLTYPWVAEHNFILGYRIDKNIKLSVDYQILPSVFTSNMPDIGKIIRHTVGVFAGIDFGSMALNFRYSDSKIFSPEEVGRVLFQVDMIYVYK
jgi:hypothetical protein